MFQLTLLQHKHKNQPTPIHTYPFTIGASPQAHLRLNHIGIWKQHATIQLNQNQQPTIQPHNQATLTINHQPTQTQQLRNGDLITIGAANLRFNTAPTKRKNLTHLETIPTLLTLLTLLTQLTLLLTLLKKI